MVNGPHSGPRCQRLKSMNRLGVVLCLALWLSGCLGSTYQRGYVFDQALLEQIPVGSSQDQVLLVLGTPSTIATVSGEVFYYISQRTEQKVAFLPPEVVDQRVLAIYFDQNRRIERIANYGIKDGKLFDFVSRTTPTSGQEMTLLNQIFGSLVNMLQRQ